MRALTFDSTSHPRFPGAGMATGGGIIAWMVDPCRVGRRARPCGLLRRPKRVQRRQGRSRASRTKGRSGRCRYDAEGRGSPIIDCIVPDRRNHDQRILHRHLYQLSAGPSYERCTLWRQPQFDNPAGDDRLRKTIARTPASMPGMEEDEMHGRIRGPGKFATSFKRAELLDVHRFRDGP